MGKKTKCISNHICNGSGFNIGGGVVLISKIKVYDDKGRVTEVTFLPEITDIKRDGANISEDKIAAIRRILEDRG